MNLFDVLPENLFSILSSPNKKIYINALFVIRECFAQEMSISRDEVAIVITSKMEDELLQIQLEEEEKINNSLSEMAYYILRRLKSTGWIETETEDRTFKENIILPDYTIEILNLLYALTHKSNLEYNSYAYQTYATLKVAVFEENSRLYDAAQLAYDNANKLENALKSLHHNLGRHYKKMLELLDINSILKEHFGSYKDYIDKIYHPLKTDDPVELYKIPICKMVDRIIGQDALLEELLKQANKTGNYKTQEEAKADILQKLFRVQDIFSNINRKIKVVDNKNSEYITATSRKVGYLLTNDKELKGKLIHILKNAKEEKNIKVMEKNLNLYHQTYIDKDSIFARNSKSEKKNGKPLQMEEVEIESEEELKEFIKKVQNSYTTERVKNYMNDILGEKQIITINDVEINTEEDFILLILGTMSEEKSFYQIEYKQNIVKKGKYRIPEMIIRRR